MGISDILDKVRGLTQPVDDEEELLDELEHHDIPVIQTVRGAAAERSASQPRERRSQTSSGGYGRGGYARGFSEPRNTTSSAPARNPVREHEQDKVVNIRPGERPQLLTISPRQFDLNEESMRIINQFRDNKIILLNLEGEDDNKANLLKHVLSGAAYALRGDMKRVGNRIYVMIPNAVDYSDFAEAGSKSFSSDDFSNEYDGFTF